MASSSGAVVNTIEEVNTTEDRLKNLLEAQAISIFQTGLKEDKEHLFPERDFSKLTVRTQQLYIDEVTRIVLEMMDLGGWDAMAQKYEKYRLSEANDKAVFIEILALTGALEGDELYQKIRLEADRDLKAKHAMEAERARDMEAIRARGRELEAKRAMEAALARAMNAAPAEEVKVVDPNEEKDEDSDETVKKVDKGKKRPNESAAETPVSSKKTDPEKTDGKKAGHTAIPHPKEGGKTDAKSPKSGGQDSGCSKKT